MWLNRAVVLGISFGMALGANAGLLEPGQHIRVIPFSISDGDKPMLEALVAGKNGHLLFDNGTPDALLLNRAALALPAGKFLARGNAASGQVVVIHEHPTPVVEIAGQKVRLPVRIRSGDFAFTAPAFGMDFLGFVGTKMIDTDAFLLDYPRHQLALFRTDKNGTLPLPPPQTGDIVATMRFMIWPGGLPTFAAAIGTLPIVTDIDTGDGGTLYVTTATRSQLITQRLLEADGTKWHLRGLSIAGVLFEPTPVRLVVAGGPEDFRTEGHLDQLRLGSAFLAAHTCLWNFPTKTLTFLKPDSAFLVRLRELPVPALMSR